MAPRGAAHVERAGEVDEKYRLDQVGREVVERFVAQDARVVDDDREAAELVQRVLDYALPSLGSGDVVVVGDRGAAGGVDLLDHGRGRVGIAGQVVDDDASAAPRKLEGVAAAEPTARAGDDRNVTVEGQHVRPS